MSEFDVIVLYYLRTYGLPIVSVLGFFMLIASNYNSIRNKILSRIVLRFDVSYEKVMNEHKKALFQPLHEIESADWKLRNKGLIRILEIGFRTGENLKYYPKNCHLIVIDRNVYIESYLNSNPELTCNVNTEQVLVSNGESLKVIPDNSVDAVVGTFILCSVINVNQVLSEIRRILSPGGQYFFLEHCPEPQDSFLCKMQNILTATRVWPTIFNGCHLNRDIRQNIKRAQFSHVNCQNVTVENEQHAFSKLVQSHVIGTAIK